MWLPSIEHAGVCINMNHLLLDHEFWWIHNIHKLLLCIYFCFPPWNVAKGTNLTEEMREEYINLTKMQQISIENIKNIYVTGKFNVVYQCKIEGNWSTPQKNLFLTWLYRKIANKILQNTGNMNWPFISFFCILQIHVLNGGL